MAEQDRFSPESFLTAVQMQLKGLDASEQREILEELRDHLEDAAPSVGEGAPGEDALERAAAEMGDPSEVGRRLRQEHMAKRLPLRYGLLAAVPLLAFFLYFEVWPIAVYFILPQGQNPGALIGGMQMFLFAALLGLSIWSWRNGNRLLAASLLGLMGPYVISTLNIMLVGLWRLTPLPALLAPMFPPAPNLRLDAAEATWLGVGSWVTPSMLFLPLLLLFVRWGRLHSSLAILGGAGAVTAFHWADSPPGLLKLLAYLAIAAGLVVLVAAPRRWQTVAAWAVVAVNCALLALGRWYFIVYEAPHAMNAQWRAANPPTLEVILRGMPYSALVFVVALLLASQILASVRARDNPPRMMPRR